MKRLSLGFLCASLSLFPIGLNSAQAFPSKFVSSFIDTPNTQATDFTWSLNDRPVYDLKHLIVDAKDNLSQQELDELAKDYNLQFEPTALFEQTKEELASLPDESVITDDMADVLIDRMSHDARVEIVERLSYVYASMVPNDPKFKEQWNMERVGATKAWDFSTGRGITVAVIDTGVACDNRDGFHKLTDLTQTECVPGWNFVDKNDNAADDHGHGSHVAGTIAQSTNNEVGVVGLAFHARIMPIKVLAAQGGGTTEDVAAGIRWAADHGAQVINMSLGGGPNSAIMQKAITYAHNKGVTVVAAAGNSGNRVEYPGGSENVVGVAATDNTDALAKFSCRGDGVDLSAPGVNILQQTICERGKHKCEQYAAWNGTSMASPHVAGVAAMIVGLGVSDPKAVEQVLKDSASKLDDPKAGTGLLNAEVAVRNVTVSHVLWRTLALLVLTGWVGHWVAKQKNSVSPWNWKFLLGGLVSSTGLFFFAPWVLSRSDLIVDLLARPLADLDLVLFGQSVHRWLPLGSAILPFALTICFYKMKQVRTAVAGITTGTAAYLVATIKLNETVWVFSKPFMTIWFVVNVVVCLWLARENLVGPEESKTPVV